MTNEEAVKVLIKFKELNDKSQPLIVFDAIDLAIQAIKERDAAIADLKEVSVLKRTCRYCKHKDSGSPCFDCEYNTFDKWEWRGIPPKKES